MQHQIALNFYDGYDSQTIRIDTDSLNDIRQIQQIFQQLANGAIASFDFLSLPNVVANNVATLTLRLVKTERTKTTRKVEGKHFEWLRDTEGWRDSAEMIDGILINQQPGHQYLSDGLMDDVLIIVAYQET